MNEPARRWWVAHPGARDYYAAPASLARAGMLAGFYTDFWLSGARARLLGRRLMPAISGRNHPDLPDELVHARNLRSLSGRVLNRERDVYRRWTDDGHVFACWAAEDLKRRAGSQDAVLAYTGSALELLRFATERGLPGILAQIDPGPAWYRARAQARAAWPSVEPDSTRLEAGFVDRVRAELAAATAILVNSPHAARSLVEEGVKGSKISVVPLSSGFIAAPSPIRTPRPDQPLRVLFAGTVSAVKGFREFGLASRLVGPGFEFHAAGGSAVTADALTGEGWPIHFHGHLPRARLLALMRDSHVFVFPTWSDGFGLVQLEAMSQGLPVIATDRCGEVVEDGVSGYVVPARDPGAIADRLARLRASPEEHRAMSAAALRRVTDFDAEVIGPRFLHTLARIGA